MISKIYIKTIYSPISGKDQTRSIYEIMLMSEKVLGLSTSSPSSNTSSSPPSSHAKTHSSTDKSDPHNASQGNFAGYSSTITKDKIASNSLSFQTSTPSASSVHRTADSNLLNSWSNKTLGSTSFRADHSNDGNKSTSSFSSPPSSVCAVSASDTWMSASTRKTGFLEKSVDAVTNKSKRKREEWTHVNNDDSNNSFRHRHVKLNNKNSNSTLEREIKNRICVVNIGHKIETQLPVSELKSLRENRYVNLVNLNEYLSSVLSEKKSSSFNKSNNSQNNNISTPSSSHSARFKKIRGIADSKRITNDSVKHIKTNLDGEGRSSSSTLHVKKYNHIIDSSSSSDECNASSKRSKLQYNRCMGPKSRRERRELIIKESKEIKMTAEDRYDALICNTTTSKTGKGNDNEPKRSSTTTSNQQTRQKYDDRKQLHDERSTHGNKYNEQGSIRHGHTEKDWQNFDSLNDGSGDGKGNAHTSESSRTSISNHDVVQGNQKLTSLKDKLQCFIKPSKVNDVPHLYQATTSQSFGDGKSLEKSIERLKNPSINTVSNELHSSTIKNTCSIGPENPLTRLTFPSSTSHHQSTAVTTNASVLSTKRVTSSDIRPKSSLHLNRSTSGLSSLFSDTTTPSKLPKENNLTPAELTTVPSDSTMNREESGKYPQEGSQPAKQPSIVASYSIKNFEDVLEGENIKVNDEEVDWDLQPISPKPNKNSINDASTATASLHQRFFPNRYEGYKKADSGQRSFGRAGHSNEIKSREKQGKHLKTIMFPI